MEADAVQRRGRGGEEIAKIHLQLSPRQRPFEYTGEYTIRDLKSLLPSYQQRGEYTQIFLHLCQFICQ